MTIKYPESIKKNSHFTKAPTRSDQPYGNLSINQRRLFNSIARPSAQDYSTHKHTDIHTAYLLFLSLSNDRRVHIAGNFLSRLEPATLLKPGCYHYTATPATYNKIILSKRKRRYCPATAAVGGA